MMNYSIEPRDQIFAKDYDYLFFATKLIIIRYIGKKLRKNQVINTDKKFLIMLKNLLQMSLKLQEDQFKKQKKQQVI